MSRIHTAALAASAAIALFAGGWAAFAPRRAEVARATDAAAGAPHARTAASGRAGDSARTAADTTEAIR
ncbi:hypothetical protein [Agromyces tropicus]